MAGGENMLTELGLFKMFHERITSLNFVSSSNTKMTRPLQDHKIWQSGYSERNTHCSEAGILRSLAVRREMLSHRYPPSCWIFNAVVNIQPSIIRNPLPNNVDLPAPSTVILFLSSSIQKRLRCIGMDLRNLPSSWEIW